MNSQTDSGKTTTKHNATHDLRWHHDPILMATRLPRIPPRRPLVFARMLSHACKRKRLSFQRWLLSFALALRPSSHAHTSLASFFHFCTQLCK